MTQATERRRSLRVQVGKGIVFLRASGVPSIACSLADLSAEGFSCVAPLNMLDTETANRWKDTLGVVGQRMAVDISAPPHLPGMHLEVETRHCRETGQGLMVGFRFHALETRDANMLRQALPSFFKAGSSAEHPAVQTESWQAAHGSEKPKQEEKKEEKREKESSHFGPKSAFSNGSNAAQINTFYPPVSADDMYFGKKLGEILVNLSKLTETQVAEAEMAARHAKEPLGKFLLRRAMIGPADLCSALALQAGLPVIDLTDTEIDPELLTIFPPLTMLRYQFIPFAQNYQSISIAATRPLPNQLLMDLRKKCLKKLQVFIAPDDVVIAKLYKGKPGGQRKLRKHKRYEIAVPAFFFFAKSLEAPQEGLLYEGRTITVSEGGLTIGTHENISPRGMNVRIRFTLPPNTVEGLYTIRHSKRRSIETFEDTPWITGLEVLEMSAVSRSNLKAMCVRLGIWQQAAESGKKAEE